MNPTLKKKIQTMNELLLAEYGPQKCFLEHANPFQLLVATMLSAQCTDRMVNRVTPGLFKKYPTPAALAAADAAELETIIHPCGFYHAKAKNLRAMAEKLVRDFHGEVPEDMESLTSLPGVGRKTANVVLGDAFGVPGLPVDTHVTRIANKTGAADTEDPVKIESILCEALPPEVWADFSHRMILHGRECCRAGRPQCESCILSDLCRANGRKTKGKE